MIFPDAVGTVEYSLCEYIVYIPENLSVITFHSKSKKDFQEEIKFEDWGFEEIEKLRVYSVVLTSDTKAAIFSIYPQTAKLKFNGEEVKLGEMGTAVVEGRVGQYPYEVSAEGYETETGIVSLREDDISTTTNVILQQRQYPLTLRCNIDDAELLIDNVSQGTVGNAVGLQLTEGEHVIRLTAPKYKDFEKQLYVNKGVELDIAMEEIQQKVIEYKEERSRTQINIRNAHYIKFGGEIYDKEKYYGFEWGAKLEYSYCLHFWAIGEFRTGLSLGLMGLNGDIKEDMYGEPALSDIGGFLEVPVQVGIGFPFGKFNKHSASILVGGYARGYYIGYDSEEVEDGDEVEVYDSDYGLRATLKADISKFSIGVELSKSLNDGGIYPGITVGWKFY